MPPSLIAINCIKCIESIHAQVARKERARQEAMGGDGWTVVVRSKGRRKTKDAGGITVQSGGVAAAAAASAAAAKQVSLVVRACGWVCMCLQHSRACLCGKFRSLVCVCKHACCGGAIRWLAPPGRMWVVIHVRAPFDVGPLGTVPTPSCLCAIELVLH